MALRRHLKMEWESLDLLEHAIDKRIEAISAVNEYYQRLLEKIRAINQTCLRVEVLSGTLKAIQTEKRLVEAPLDDILEKARQTRNTRSTRGQEQQPPRPAAAEDPRILYLESELAEHGNRLESVYKGMRSLQRHFGKNRPQAVSELLSVSKDFSMAYSDVASRLENGCTVVPSVPLAVIHQESTSHDFLEGFKGDIVAISASHRQKFVRVIRSRLERANLVLLSPQDTEEFVHFWYKAQIIACLLCRAIRGSSSQPESQSSYSSALPPPPCLQLSDIPQDFEAAFRLFILRNVDYLPLATPLRTIPPRVDLMREPTWIDQHISDVNKFHDFLRHRVEFVLESILGKLSLKRLIKELKACCEIESLGSSMKPADKRAMWISTLKKLRLLYGILTNETSVSNVVFFNK